MLLDHKVSVDCKDCLENTPLHLASVLNDEAACMQRTLHISKKSLDHKDCYGMTPLMCAIDAGKLKAVQVCLEAGASLHETDMHHRSPLFLALEKQNEPIFGLLAR